MKPVDQETRINRHAFPALVCLFIFTSTHLISSPQTTVTEPGISGTGIPEEELYIFTDRDVYISGEDVYLKVCCLDRKTRKPSGLSKVAYVTLLDKTSTPVVRIKIWMNGQSGSGKFTIPDTLSTGNYIVNGCTQLMRNYPPGSFVARKISVINPYIKTDLVETNRSDVVSGDTFQNDTEPGRMPEYWETDDSKAECNIQTDKASYHPREKVLVTVRSVSKDGKPAVGDLTLSVTRAFANYGTDRNIPAGTVKDPGPGENFPASARNKEKIFLPEPEGHLVTGTVYNTVTGDPVTNETMVLSFVGKTSLCRFSKTDEEGAFYFVINESARQEIVIQPLNPELKDLYVELNDPFPDEYNRYDVGQYFIDTTRLKEINDAVVSSQVQALYRASGDTPGKLRKKQPIHDFYGDPGYEVNLADFIELTSLGEVFRELLPVVFTETRRGIRRLVLENSSPDERFLADPMVLVDGVPVSDHDAVLRISPGEVETIRILNSRYYVSDICIKGIIDIKTIKGNFRVDGLDLPALRQEFEAPLSGSDFLPAVYLTDTHKQSRIPDFRNTLYWNPDISTDKNGIAVAGFYTSDEPGDYVIIARGFTEDGQTVSASSVISVLPR